MPSQSDFSYLAGLVDADGGITLHRSKSCVVPIVSVTNTWQPLMPWLEETFGGHSNVCSRAKAGSNHKSEWVWRLIGRSAVALLDDISPFLRIKPQQAWLAREFAAQSTPTPRGGGRRVPDEEAALRFGFVTAMRFLNRVGRS